MKPKIFCLCFVLILSSSGLFGADWDIEYWQYLKWNNWNCGAGSFYTSGELRFDHNVSTICYYRISENFALKATPNLDLEAHYSYVYHKPIWAKEFRNSSRIELEANPHWITKNGIVFRSRNRLELIKRQNVSRIAIVGRHRSLISIPFNCRGNIRALNIYDEIFYNFEEKKFNENRFVPVELACDLSRAFKLNIFFMIRNLYGASPQKWYRSFVFGSTLEF